MKKTVSVVLALLCMLTTFSFALTVNAAPTPPTYDLDRVGTLETGTIIQPGTLLKFAPTSKKLTITFDPGSFDFKPDPYNPGTFQTLYPTVAGGYTQFIQPQPASDQIPVDCIYTIPAPFDESISIYTGEILDSQGVTTKSDLLVPMKITFEHCIFAGWSVTNCTNQANKHPTLVLKAVWIEDPSNQFPPPVVEEPTLWQQFTAFLKSIGQKLLDLIMPIARLIIPFFM